MLLLTVVWLAMVIFADPVGDFPVNDDWVYAAAVRSVIVDGRLEIYSFSSANLGPQVYWGALFAKLFGLSFTSLRFSTLVLGLAGGFAAYHLFLEMWRDRGRALVFALCVLVNPIYFGLSNSFMTDVPFFTLTAISMALLVAGFGRDRAGLLAGGVGVALLAMLLRQFAIIVLVGFAVAYVIRRGTSIKSLLTAILPFLVAILLNWLYAKWLLDTGRKPFSSGISSLMPSLKIKFLGSAKATLFSALSYAGLFLIPLWIACLPSGRLGVVIKRAKVFSGVFILISVLLGYVYLVRHLRVPIGQNVMNWYGLGPLSNGDTLMHNQNLPIESLTVTRVWILVTALTIFVSASLVCAGVIGLRRLGIAFLAPRGDIAVRKIAQSAFLIGGVTSYLGILILLAGGYIVFDRYMLPLLLFGGLLLPVGLNSDSLFLAGPSRAFFAFVALAAMAAFSVVATHDFLRWSSVRWTALNQLVAEGVSPRKIDGGYEFNGWYLYDPRYKATEDKSWWWVDDNEYQTSSGPIEGYRELRRYPVNRWWKNGSSDVIILKRQ